MGNLFNIKQYGRSTKKDRHFRNNRTILLKSLKKRKKVVPKLINYVIIHITNRKAEINNNSIVSDHSNVFGRV